MNTENNKIIAEFMGFELFEGKYYELSQFGYIKTNGEWSDVFYPSTVRFHKDWNWLMEVVEKISEYRLVYPEQANKVCNLKVVINRDALYNACVEFIKWYNEQKQN